MATFNIETTIASGSYHKRSTGMTGQVLASAEIEAKLCLLYTSDAADE